MRRAPPSCVSTPEKCLFKAGRLDGKGKSQKPEHKSKKEFRQGCKPRKRRGVVCCKCKSASDVFLASAISLQTAPTVPCAAIPGCMIPPAIPIISGYFIISGCSHNSDLNGWCVLVHHLEQLRKKRNDKWPHQVFLDHESPPLPV